MLNDTDPIHGTPMLIPNTFAEPIDLMRIVEGAKMGMMAGGKYLLNKNDYKQLTLLA